MNTQSIEVIVTIKNMYKFSTLLGHMFMRKDGTSEQTNA